MIGGNKPSSLYSTGKISEPRVLRIIFGSKKKHTTVFSCGKSTNKTVKNVHVSVVVMTDVCRGGKEEST